MTALDGAHWTLTNPVSAKRLMRMSTVGIPLHKYTSATVFRGVLTGCNEAFIISGATRAALIGSDSRSAEIIKPLIVGRDVHKWRCEQEDRWLIFTRRGINIDAYPAIKSHLEQWREQLEPKPRDWPAGMKWPGRKSGAYKWYEIQDEIAYFREFEKPKILYQEIATYQSFTFDTTGSFTNNKVFMIPSDDLYLLGVLNSSLAWEFLNETCSKLAGGALAMQTPYLAQLPIPVAPDSERAIISSFVQKCLDARGTGCEGWEQEIDKRVAALYGM